MPQKRVLVRKGLLIHVFQVCLSEGGVQGRIMAAMPLQAAGMLYSVYDAVGECTQDFPFQKPYTKPWVM